MDASDFKASTIEIKDEPQSDHEDGFDAMEFVEIEGSQLVHQIEREVEETQESKKSESVISNLQTKLEEIAHNNAGEGFIIQITDQEYFAIGERKIFFMARLTKLVQGYCRKSLRLYKVCNRCGFKAIQEKDMDKHFEGGPCDSYHHALGTFDKLTFLLQCATCFYRSNVRYNLLRHQEKLGHVGIRKVRADSQPSDEADGGSIEENALKINSQEILKNLQSKLEQEAKKCEKEFLLRISKEEFDTISETKYSLVTKLSKVVRSYCNKDVKHYHVCDDCGFKTSIADDMKQHLENGTCSNCFNAIGTCPKRNRRAQLLQCNACDFKTDQIGNMRRHLTMRGHEGFEKSIPPRPSIAERSADQSENESNSAKKRRKPAPVHIMSCPHCGLQMQSTNQRRHYRLYCAVLLKKPPKISTDYDLPVDEHGSPVMKCQDCGKTFGQYYYMKRHLGNGCPVMKQLKKEANSDERQQKRKYHQRKVGVRQTKERAAVATSETDEED